MTGRTLIVGDVHGCADELYALLDKVGLQRHERLISVGDLVARGPDSRAVLELMRERSALAVRGNHEARLLQWRAEPDAVVLSESHRAVVPLLCEADWLWLEQLPLWLDLPEHGVRVLHGGVRPGLPWAEQQSADLLNLRNVHDAQGRSVKWGTLYAETPHVVFGHDAREGLQLLAHCTGIDTGCVYGGRLTGLLLEPGQLIPGAPLLRSACLVSVDAKARHYDPLRKGP